MTFAVEQIPGHGLKFHTVHRVGDLKLISWTEISCQRVDTPVHDEMQWLFLRARSQAEFVATVFCLCSQSYHNPEGHVVLVHRLLALLVDWVPSRHVPVPNCPFEALQHFHRMKLVRCTNGGLVIVQNGPGGLMFGADEQKVLVVAQVMAAQQFDDGSGGHWVALWHSDLGQWGEVECSQERPEMVKEHIGL